LILTLAGPASAGWKRRVCPSCTSPDFSSINQAITTGPALSSDDTVIVDAGTYRELVDINNLGGTAGHPAIIKANGAVTIEGSESPTWTACGGGTGVYHATVHFGMPYNERVSVDTVFYSYDSTGWVNCNMSAGTYSYDVAHDEVYVKLPGGASPGANTFVSVRANGFDVRGSSSYIIIDGFTVTHTRDKGVRVRGTTGSRVQSITVQNCTAAYNKRHGIYLEFVSNGSVLHNLTYNNARHGICLHASDNCYVAYNESFKNDNPLETRGGIVGIKIGDSSDTSLAVTYATVDYNVVHNNEDSGIELNGARHILVRRNLSYRNQDHGYDNQQLDVAVYQNNVAARNDHEGMSIENSASNVEIYNCIFAGNAVYPFTLGSPGGIRELFIRNTTGFASDYNVVIGLGAQTWDEVQGHYYRTLVEYDGTPYDTWATYRGAHSGLDANSKNSDPMFRDSTVAADFRIGDSDSDALDGAESGRADWLATDPRGFGTYDGSHSNGGHGTVTYADIGAYEDVEPGAVADLRADFVGSQSVHLLWTATGDDRTTGTTCAAADLRYSTSPITEGTFGAATAANPQPTPSAPGSTQGYTVSGLTMCTQYYFALKFGDANGNVSALGDTALAITRGVQYHGFWICDDGGGERARLAADARLSAGAGRAADAEATLGGRTTTPSAAASMGSGTVLIVEAAPGPSGLELKLMALAGEDASGYPEGSGAGVLYQRPDGAGGWTTRLQYSLPEGSGLALLAPDRPGRWVFLDPMTTLGVNSAPLADGTSWQLEQAHHSRLGDVTTALAETDQPPALSPGDTLVVQYSGALAAGESIPSWLVSMDKPTSGATPTRAGGPDRDPSSTVPTVFALHQNQPNPFAATTTFRFDLPRSERVRLEVFDLMGRKVATLRDAWMPAGRHSPGWNSRDANGSPVRPGVYLYRLTAGSFRGQKKLVVLP